jgi:heme A synthase
MNFINFILLLHQYNFYLIVAAGAIAGIWGLVLYFTRRSPQKPWWISLIVTLALGVLQGLFGLTLVFLGHKAPHDNLHYLYGGIVVFIIPLAWLSFASGGKNQRKDILIYSIAVLILVAAALRAWNTGLA